MNEWLTEFAEPAVLVTVAAVEGSGPREPGAHMLVGMAHLADTIGGGHLELRAIEIARQMLAQGRARHIERFALGPSLGQCCGGVVHLAFERVAPAQFAVLCAHAHEDICRVVAFDGPAESHVIPAQTGTPERVPRDVMAAVEAHRHRDPRLRGDDRLVVQEDGRRWLIDWISAPRAHVMLFGAGHVGAAVVRALAPLPCTITWVDEREDMFPPDLPANVRIEATDAPEAVVAQAPALASYLVMTHSHALDQRLTEAILARPDVGWFGLIGSRTKRKQFEHRLRARGFDQDRIDAMVCPIGLPGIASKLPAAIAASVAAQLLTVWEAQAADAAAPSARRQA